MGQHLPGYEVGRTLSDREVLLSTGGMIQVPIVVDGNLGIDGANGNFSYEIRAGWLMGRVTASGRWVPCKRTTVTPSGGATGTEVPVVNAAAFRVGDVISVGADTNKTITAINYGTNVITVSGSFAFANNEAVVAQDGTQTARGVLLDFVKLRNDDNTAAVHRSAGLLIQGAVRASMLLGDVAAIRADTSAKLAGLRFSDDHGQ